MVSPSTPSSESKNFLVLGLAESGKSTFLAALWNLTTDPASGPDSLRVVSFSGNREYIQQIESDWLDGKKLQRTLTSSDHRVRLTLAGPPLPGPLSLTLPDLSGEDFRSCFARREWPVSLDDFVRSLDGILLFINPMTLVPPRLLTDINATAQALQQGEAESHREGGDGAQSRRAHGSASSTEGPVSAGIREGKPWDPAATPCAPVLVDLIMAIADRRNDAIRRLPIALIVSAWDTMDGTGVSPQQWVSLHAALLEQYLTANDETFSLRIFGVSAQGGDVSNPHVRAQLLALNDPFQRIKVVDGEHFGHDLTRPLVWLLRMAGTE